VNLARHTHATCILAVRHRDKPGVLAAVLGAVSAARINVQEMENTIFEGAEAAVAHIHLERTPSAEMLEDIRRSNPHILELQVILLAA
jgi:D-3-phosphoglycerate dehydrogenase